MKSAATPGEALPRSAWGDHVIQLDASQIRAAAHSDQVAFSQLKSDHVDQSWMPDWFTNAKPTGEIPGNRRSMFAIAEECIDVS